MAKIVNTNTSSKFCKVCNHPERGEIEMALLNIGPNNPSITLESIAHDYGIAVTDLQRHALMHTPLVVNPTQEAVAETVKTFRDKAGLSTTATESAESASYSDSSATVSHKVRERMTDKIGMREGDLLLATANEYYTTLAILGQRIKRYATDSEFETNIPAFCTNAVVNLYIGCGSEIRNAIKGINELNTAVNGAHDPGADGMKALAEAIIKS